MGTNRILDILLIVVCCVVSGSIDGSVLAQNLDRPANHYYQAQRQFQSNLRSSMPSSQKIGYARNRQDDPFGENQTPPAENSAQDPVGKQEGVTKQLQDFDPFADPPNEDQATKQPPPQQPAGQDPFGEDQQTEPQPRQPQLREPQLREPQLRQPQPRQPLLNQNPSSNDQPDVSEYPPGTVKPETIEPNRREPDSAPELTVPRQPTEQQPQSQPRTNQEPRLNWDNTQSAPPLPPQNSFSDPSVGSAVQPLPNTYPAQPYEPNYQQPYQQSFQQPYQQPYQQQPYQQQPYSQQPYQQQPSAGSPFDNSPLHGVAGQEYLSSDMSCQDCGFECGAPMFYFSAYGGSARLDDLVSLDRTSRIFTKNGAGFGVAIGQRHGTNLRSELEYGYRTNDIIGRENQNVGQTVTGDVRSNAGMANVYWELMNFPHRCFKPYVGAGLGFVSLEMNMYGVDGRNLIPQNATDDTSLAYQFMGGVNYKAYRNMDLFIEYRLFQADSYRVDAGAGFGDGKYDYQTDNLFAGLRWKF